MQELYENLRVLIVDDNLMMRSMINQGLQSSGIGATDMDSKGTSFLFTLPYSV